MQTHKTLATLFLSIISIVGVSSTTIAQPAPAPSELQSDQDQSKPISAAEKRVFIDNHLQNLSKKAVLDYNFKRTGSLGDNFEDKVVLNIREGKKEQGRIGSAEFLTGKRKLFLPEVPNLEGNPIVLYFLERDIRELEKITTGKSSFFRRRIRLALSETNELKPVTIQYQGQTIQASEISIQPYLNDPLKARFEKYEKKNYIFTIADKIPGGFYSIKTIVPAADGSSETPLVEETLTFVKVRK